MSIDRGYRSDINQPHPAYPRPSGILASRRRPDQQHPFQTPSSQSIPPFLLLCRPTFDNAVNSPDRDSFCIVTDRRIGRRRLLVHPEDHEIGFYPNEDKGSTCPFTMEPAAPPPPPIQLQPYIKLSDAAQAKKILLVEDNVVNQNLILRMLSCFGLTSVDVAANGKEGVDMVTVAPSAYSLILMDPACRL